MGNIEFKGTIKEITYTGFNVVRFLIYNGDKGILATIQKERAEEIEIGGSYDITGRYSIYESNNGSIYNTFYVEELMKLESERV